MGSNPHNLKIGLGWLVKKANENGLRTFGCSKSQHEVHESAIESVKAHWSKINTFNPLLSQLFKKKLILGMAKFLEWLLVFF